MATSRRKFIKAGTLGVLCAGIPIKAVAREVLDVPSGTATAAGVDEALPRLDMQAFSQQLKTEFRIKHRNAKTVNVKLVEVKDLRPAAGMLTHSKECFSVVFHSSQRPALRQETYAVEHGSLGKFSLFLVPVGMNKDGQYYEAVFNRLR